VLSPQADIAGSVSLAACRRLSGMNATKEVDFGSRQRILNLLAQQKPPSLLNRSVGVFGKLLVRRATDGMADDNKSVIRHAQDAAHHFSRAHESRRHHAYGGNTLSFCCDGVVQTAR
jgi:hypothetical protein